MRTGLREHVGGVEDVEALVLHGTHVEVVDGHDVEDVEVVLQPELILVPLHRRLRMTQKKKRKENVHMIVVRVCSSRCWLFAPASSWGRCRA